VMSPILTATRPFRKVFKIFINFDPAHRRAVNESFPVRDLRQKPHYPINDLSNQPTDQSISWRRRVAQYASRIGACNGAVLDYHFPTTL
jgi:hypothetical protein